MKGRKPSISATSQAPLALSAIGRDARRWSLWKGHVGLVPRIVGLVVLVVILTGGLISTVIVRQSRDTLREQTIANNLASAELLAEFAYRYMEGTQMTIRLLARRPSVQDAILSGNFSLATSELQEFIRINNRVDGCSIFDANGINRATGNLPAIGLGNDSAGREWFRQIMATREPYLGIPVVSRGTGRPAVPYGVPVRDPHGEIEGVVLCGISLAALGDRIATFSTGPTARTSLVDLRQGGIILAHPQRERILTPISGRNEAVNQMLEGGRGTLETASSSGELNLTAFAPAPNLPWGLIILQPSDAVFAQVARSGRKGLMYGALILLLAGVISALLAGGVTRPLVHLREAASRLAAGDMSNRVNMARRDEVGDLGRAFDRMAAALAERSAQLQAAHEELRVQYSRVKDTDRLKSEFLANMSHELRTPLNAVIGFAQLIHDGKAGPVSPDQREFLNDILTSADHLLQLINDVLDLAKVESGKLEFHPEPVQLHRLISEVRNIIQPLAAGKRLEITVDVSDSVAAVVIDPAKLKQVLYNYLSNAIKFTSDEGRITIRARPEDSRHFRLEVDDTGIGILPEDLDRLFIAFQQLDSGAAKKQQGTGLGLALTKKIVEAQGGRVGVETKRSGGSTFYAILPTEIGTKNHAENQSPPAAEPAPGAPILLVIEDSDSDLRWLTRLLTGAGYFVESARTGAEAVNRARTRAYAAILLDLILPDTGGWAILHSIRWAGPNENTPVIVTSVVAEQGVAKGFPVQDYLVKPIQSEALLDALRRAGAFPRTEGREIMVVDDDAGALKLAHRSLQTGGYKAVCFDNGASALESAKHTKFAAVILDLLMPQMDGFEFLDRFRRIDKCRNTPVIVWTNRDINAADMERLKTSAQAIALKTRDGLDTVLKELQRRIPPENSPGMNNAVEEWQPGTREHR
jgi:signal transduction histidine kinase/DNA-binding response OmpR family regulator